MPCSSFSPCPYTLTFYSTFHHLSNTPLSKHSFMYLSSLQIISLYLFPPLLSISPFSLLNSSFSIHYHILILLLILPFLLYSFIIFLYFSPQQFLSSFACPFLFSLFFRRLPIHTRTQLLSLPLSLFPTLYLSLILLTPRQPFLFFNTLFHPFHNPLLPLSLEMK